MVNKKNRIYGYRAFLGMTQKDIAKYLGISPQSYSSKETGRTNFNDNEKLKLRTLFKQIDSKLTIDDIFF